VISLGWKFHLQRKSVAKLLSELNYLSKHIHPRDVPLLYLFSEADQMILKLEIMEHINIMKNNGISVRFHDFKDSPHVEHYHKHANEYVEEVLTFLSEISPQNKINELQFVEEILASLFKQYAL